jgi:hypothetical protein
MPAYVANLYSGFEEASETATIDLGSTRDFFAWCQINMMDSLADFDEDNAVAIDIFQIDGVETTSSRIWGGDHWGAADSSSNVHDGAISGRGRRITFRLRAMHSDDLESYGTGIVYVP